ncbi:hypothetical protein NHF48_018215 [Sphingomonas sp. H160509]|uniref:hypothetical protein n=1 Tax=Sphingomonas sp. H160509 TaxID=2955313 RepID=UPI002097B809|nr:hypothetical protein [Sphingomonas sp. H160509]MDD1452416.1 hypothetical protein [Sphingomonas sp. H160509]
MLRILTFRNSRLIFFDKQSNRTTKLIATCTETKPVEGRHRWFEYRFTEPAIVSAITISATGYSEFHEFDFMWMDANGKEKTGTFRVESSEYKLVLNAICRKFAFRPPSVYFANPSIDSVTVFGLEPSNISAAIDNLSLIEEYKSDAIRVINRSVESAKAKTLLAEKADLERAATQREINQNKSAIARHKKEYR